MMTLYRIFTLSSIKEDDGLPHWICVLCIGTLEYICDFYERCQFTQKKLLDTKQGAVDHESQRENDVDDNKENLIPSVCKIKGNAKNSSIVGSKIASTAKSTLAVQKDKNEEKKRVAERIQLQSNHINSAIPSTKRSEILREEKIEADRADESILESKKCEPVQNPDSKNKIGARGIKSETGENSTETYASGQGTKGAKRGRKRKLQKIQSTDKSKNLGVKRKKPNSKESTEGHSIRQYLSEIKRNDKVDTATTLVLCKSEVGEELSVQEQIQTEKVSSVQAEVKNNSVISEKNKIPVSKVFPETGKNEKSSKKIDHCLLKKNADLEEDSLSKVKVKLDEFPSISSETLIKNPGNTKKESGLINTSPPPGDEAEKDENKTRPTVIATSTRRSFGKPLENDASQQSTDMNDSENSIDRSTTNSLESNIEKVPSSQPPSRNKSKESAFGRISELITDEQKEAIETYYTIDMSVVNSQEIEKHMMIIDKKNMRCVICGLLYSRLDKCQVHIWGHLQMKPYRCKACNFSTVTVSNVRSHIRKSHLKIKPYCCTFCQKRYATAVLLDEHLNTHTGARPFTCTECDFTSASRQMLSYHKTTHKPSKDINCKICGKQFFSRSRLRAHMMVHDKGTAVMCKLCSSYLSNAKALELHNKNIHEKDYICKICGKPTKSRKALHNHKSVHSAAKYKCHLCPNVYKSRQILKEHLLKHEGIRKYKCNVCGKTFAQQSHLTAHMAVHSKIRFHCPGCEKPFNRHDNMKMHAKKCRFVLENPDLRNRLNTKAKVELIKEAVAQPTTEVMPKVDIEDRLEEPLKKTFGEIDIIPIINDDDRNIPESKESVIICENILGRECY